MNGATERSTVARRRSITIAATVAFVVSLDQITKSIAVAQLGRGEVVEVLGEWVRFDLTTNSGGSFSLFRGSTVFLALGALAASGYLIYLIRTTSDRLTVCALTLLLCGAFGNLGDRIFRAPGPLRGEVVDFIRIPRWPTFNVADMAVTFGGVLLAITVFRPRRATPPEADCDADADGNGSNELAHS